MRAHLKTLAVVVALGFTASTVAVTAAEAQGRTHKVWVCKSTKSARNKGTVVGALGGGTLGAVVAGHGNKTKAPCWAARWARSPATRSPKRTPRRRTATTSTAATRRSVPVSWTGRQDERRGVDRVDAPLSCLILADFLLDRAEPRRRGRAVASFPPSRAF